MERMRMHIVVVSEEWNESFQGRHTVRAWRTRSPARSMAGYTTQHQTCSIPDPRSPPAVT